jgi:MbtH protein
MASNELPRNVLYAVVMNHEEQYSLWPVDKDLPIGWRAEGFTGTSDECLAHIDEIWTDMRPLSLRMPDIPWLFTKRLRVMTTR